MKYAFKIGEKEYSVEVGEMISGLVPVSVNGKSFDVIVEDFMVGESKKNPAPEGRTVLPVSHKPQAPARQVISAGSGTVIAPIPGLITGIKVNVGDKVDAGQSVATMEAMKMENHLTTHISGIVQEIYVQKGSEVNTGQAIMRVE
ncbi:MAG: acetyl-CoA carboxylase biotin carboxyl carrier protein subunit [Proteobacteria bacterium]|nr:acetyl-CoA carboxylase biotin carboxyl carrier protein subunit [Pseudomonadota bacterium]